MIACREFWSEALGCVTCSWPQYTDLHALSFHKGHSAWLYLQQVFSDFRLLGCGVCCLKQLCWFSSDYCTFKIENRVIQSEKLVRFWLQMEWRLNKDSLLDPFVVMLHSRSLILHCLASCMVIQTRKSECKILGFWFLCNLNHFCLLEAWLTYRKSGDMTWMTCLFAGYECFVAH